MNILSVRLSRGLIGLAATLLLAPSASAQFLEPSLKTAIRPEPTNLNDFIADREAAVRLGKALFWDIRLGSDGQTACATCHHHAGVDSRVSNLANPGADGNFEPGCVPGQPIPANLFPTTRYQVAADRFSQQTVNIDDVVGSPGVLRETFLGLDANGNEIRSALNEPVFVANGAVHRQVTDRNTPSTINAVFNVRQFWDGRANAWFNGVNPFGPVDDTARVWKVNAETGAVEQVQIQVDHASLASQAVGPVGSGVEMAAHGRSWVDVARKLLDDPALMNQKVHPSDSVLGGYVAPGSGLTQTYQQMIAAAFKPEWWNGGEVSAGTSQMQANMALFFGLAVQVYEATLVSDESRYDQWIENNGPMGEARHLMTDEELRGLRLFFNLDPALPATNCRECHITSMFTVATYGGKVGGNILAGIGAFPVGTPDGDGDLVPDIIDAFPTDATEWVDTDGDGIGNNADPDDDNDGILDVNDPLPLEPGIGEPPPADPRLAPMPLAYMPDLTAETLATQIFEEPPLGIEPNIQRLDFPLGGTGIRILDVDDNLLAQVPLGTRNSYPCIYNAETLTPVPQFGPEAFVETIISVIDCRMTLEVLIVGFPIGEYQLLINGRNVGDLLSVAGVVYDEGFYNIAVRPPGEDPGVNGLHPNGVPLSAARRTALNPMLTEFGLMPDITGLSIQVDNAFKTPTLRNVELTGPYFHNGGAATLEDVIRFYNRGGDFHAENIASIAPAMVSMSMTEADIAAMAAFLRTLTDERVRTEQAPFDHPELPLPHAPTLPAVGADGRGATLYPLRTFTENVQDADSDGYLGLFDNCPSTFNPDQLNSDNDGFGNACDADDDNDGTDDINDAYALNPAKVDADSLMTPAAISTFLGNAVAATVDGTGMSAAQLTAVADGASHIRAAGIGGTFSLSATFSDARLAAILAKAAPATGFVGGANITIDATGMSLVQLNAIAANMAGVTRVDNLAITSSVSVGTIAALVVKAPSGEVTIVADGMSQQQLAAALLAPGSVAITGNVSVSSAFSVADIGRIATSLAAGGVISVDMAGLSADQRTAITSGASLVIDVNATAEVGEIFTVSVNFGNLPTRAVAVQARLLFDPTVIEYVANPSGIGGTAFPQTIFVSQAAGSVTFSTGVDLGGDGVGVTTGNVAQLSFRALASGCNLATGLRVAPTGFLNRISSEATGGTASAPIPFSTVQLVNVSSLSPIMFAGVPAQGISAPADAGSMLGASVTEPSVTAGNGCENLPVTLSIGFPAGSGLPNAGTWPARFPIGISTASWTSVDSRGVPVTVSRSIEIRNEQLLTLDVNLLGSVNPGISFTRPIRVRLSSGDVVTVDVAFSGSNGGVVDVAVPVRDDYGCVSVKDATHTLASSQVMSVGGTKYVVAEPFALAGGDSNDDNLVDVLDFASFVADRGLSKDASSRSNYDRNPVVNNADFTYIALNFLRTGDACGGGLAGNAPRERVSVKDLRRAGLGDLAVADLNGDGWVDATDMAMAMQGQYRNGASLDSIEEPIDHQRW